MQKVKVKNNRLINFNKKSDLDKAEKARLLIQAVINDNAFRKEILKTDFKDRRFKNESGSEEVITDNNEILKLIVSGKEQYSDAAIDFEWDLRITLYRSLSGEIGHRSRETIFTKKRKFRNYSIRFIASHWIHEYMHVIGFTHDYERTPRRPYSVPYLVGTIASNILESKNYDFLD